MAARYPAIRLLTCATVSTGASIALALGPPLSSLPPLRLGVAFPCGAKSASLETARVALAGAVGHERCDAKNDESPLAFTALGLSFCPKRCAPPRSVALSDFVVSGVRTSPVYDNCSGDVKRGSGAAACFWCPSACGAAIFRGGVSALTSTSVAFWGCAVSVHIGVTRFRTDRGMSCGTAISPMRTAPHMPGRRVRTPAMRR